MGCNPSAFQYEQTNGESGNDLEKQVYKQALDEATDTGNLWRSRYTTCCFLNLLLTGAVSYLLWYAILRPQTVQCQADYHINLGIVRRNVSAVVAELSLDTASQEQIDCFLAKYKVITFELANYSDIPFIYQWKMQLGTPDQMREVFMERRQMMNGDNFTQLYDLLNADGMWAYLYSRYYPKEVQEALMQSDMRETAMMVTMVRLPECMDELMKPYLFDNYEKYFYYTRYPSNTLAMQSASGKQCDPGLLQ